MALTARWPRACTGWPTASSTGTWSPMVTRWLSTTRAGHGAGPRIEAAIRELGRSPADISAVVLTHAHPDHLGAAEAVRQRLGAPASFIGPGWFGRTGCLPWPRNRGMTLFIGGPIAHAARVSRWPDHPQPLLELSKRRRWLGGAAVTGVVLGAGRLAALQLR